MAWLIEKYRPLCFKCGSSSKKKLNAAEDKQILIKSCEKKLCRITEGTMTHKTLTNFAIYVRMRDWFKSANANIALSVSTASMCRIGTQVAILSTYLQSLPCWGDWPFYSLLPAAIPQAATSYYPLPCGKLDSVVGQKLPQFNIRQYQLPLPGFLFFLFKPKPAYFNKRRWYQLSLGEVFEKNSKGSCRSISRKCCLVWHVPTPLYSKKQSVQILWLSKSPFSNTYL